MTKKEFYKNIEEFIIKNYGLKKMDVELFVEDFKEEIEEFAAEEEARKNERTNQK